MLGAGETGTDWVAFSSSCGTVSSGLFLLSALVRVSQKVFPGTINGVNRC